MNPRERQHLGYEFPRCKWDKFVIVLCGNQSWVSKIVLFLREQGMRTGKQAGVKFMGLTVGSQELSFE